MIQHNEVRSGLIVDQVYGMRRFPVDIRQSVEINDAIKPLEALLSGSFEEEDIFHVMEVEKLVNETGFMQAAA